MKRLNIPLRRHYRTTHQPRWVFWILAIFFVSVLLLTYLLSTLWFTRPSLLKAAPIDTEIAINIIATKSNTPSLIQYLNNIPLISNRSLTINDLKPQIKRGFALFINKDGSRSVALNTKIDNLPIALLDSHSIVVQKIDKNTVLLSERLMPAGKMLVTHNIKSTFPFINKKLLATIHTSENNNGFIYKTADSLEIIISNLELPVLSRSVPDNTIAFLSTPVSTKNDALFMFLLGNTEHVIDSVSTKQIIMDILSSKGSFIITKTDKNIDILIESDLNITEKERVDLIKMIVSAQNPIIEVMELDDGTYMKEILIQPELLSVEEIIIMGHEIIRISNKNTGPYFINKNGNLIFSTNEANLRFWLNEDLNENMLKICNANSVGILLDPFIESFKSKDAFIKPLNFYDILSKFNGIGVKAQKNGVKISICV